MRGVGNRHLQTMLPRLIRRKLRFTPHWQRLELPDGDFVDLAWSEDPHQRAISRASSFFTAWKAVCTARTPMV
ncbi:Hydrolase, alpha/beta fold family functionally coupled to Phosphoribulokinase [Klebsiella pneumoniae IS43]|uniref:Hydrolase, alpha/beta fold family functionally coupled to Phosphoribulokinase n=1 Tax=Klebsiella pneumoniae IS43 TaxID=1432552 RepID=W1DQI7_KLEPN|nr:Hydrolase, alpha/beta fold family functionally coupled to Phosphoribulokinase [Klebsiella pneumoniae IS43]